jgi:hypothetical protein
VTPHQIVALCLRLVALIWLLYTLSHTHELFAYVKNYSGIVINKPVVWLFAILQIATCAVLWFFPATIAAKLLPSAAGAEPVRSPSPLVEWQTLGVICVGIWALSQAIPDSIYWITSYGMMMSASDGIFDMGPEQKAGIVAAAVRLVIGFWLVFGAKGFAAFLFKIRTAGMAK